MLTETSFYPECREDRVKTSQIIERGLKRALKEGRKQIFVEIWGPSAKSLVADLILSELNDEDSPYFLPKRECFSLEVGAEGCPAAWDMLRTQFNSNGEVLDFGFTTMPFSSFDYIGLPNAPEPYDSWGCNVEIDYIKNTLSTKSPQQILIFSHKRRRSHEVNLSKSDEFDEGIYDFIDLTISMEQPWKISLDKADLQSSPAMQEALMQIDNSYAYRQMRRSSLTL